MKALKPEHIIYSRTSESDAYVKIPTQPSPLVIYDLPHTIRKTPVNKFSRNLCFGLKASLAFLKSEFTLMHKTRSKILFYGTMRVYSSDNLLIIIEDGDFLHVFIYNDRNYSICPQTQKLVEKEAAFLLAKIQDFNLL